MCVLYIPQFLWLVRRLGTVNRFNHTSLMTVVSPTDRHKSVRNRSLIEGFGGAFVLSIGFRIFCWYELFFVIGLSQISFFFYSYL